MRWLRPPVVTLFLSATQGSDSKASALAGGSKQRAKQSISRSSLECFWITYKEMFPQDEQRNINEGPINPRGKQRRLPSFESRPTQSALRSGGTGAVKVTQDTASISDGETTSRRHHRARDVRCFITHTVARTIDHQVAATARKAAASPDLHTPGDTQTHITSQRERRRWSNVNYPSGWF